MARPLLRSPPAVALLAGALAVRLAVVRLTSGYVPHHDDRSYLTYAGPSTARGAARVGPRRRANPDRLPGPGFPALLAAARAVAGPELGPLRIAQALVGVALVALVGVVAAQLWGRRAGLAALALAAVSPPLVLFGASLVSEPLYAALETAAMAAALRARRERHHPLGWALATGALGGAAALTRPAGLVLLPALALVALPRARAGRARLGAALAVVLAGVAVVSPWTARDARVLHASCRSAPRRATRGRDLQPGLRARPGLALGLARPAGERHRPGRAGGPPVRRAGDRRRTPGGRAAIRRRAPHRAARGRAARRRPAGRAGAAGVVAALAGDREPRRRRRRPGRPARGLRPDHAPGRRRGRRGPAAHPARRVVGRRRARAGRRRPGGRRAALRGAPAALAPGARRPRWRRRPSACARAARRSPPPAAAAPAPAAAGAGATPRPGNPVPAAGAGTRPPAG